MKEYEDALVFTREETRSTAGGSERDSERGRETKVAGVDPFAFAPNGVCPPFDQRIIGASERSPIDDYVSPVVARFYRGLR